MNGEMRSYGLGVHISTDTQGKDVVWPGYFMKGHTGFAYGLASNMWFNPEDRSGFVYAANGALNHYHYSNSSGFIVVSQEVMMATYEFVYGKQTNL